MTVNSNKNTQNNSNHQTTKVVVNVQAPPAPKRRQRKKSPGGGEGGDGGGAGGPAPLPVQPSTGSSTMNSAYANRPSVYAPSVSVVAPQGLPIPSYFESAHTNLEATLNSMRDGFAQQLSTIHNQLLANATTPEELQEVHRATMATQTSFNNELQSHANAPMNVTPPTAVLRPSYTTNATQTSQPSHSVNATQTSQPSHSVNATQTLPMHDNLGTQTSPMHDNLATQTSLNSEHQSHYGAEGEQHQTFTMMGRDDTPVKHPEIEPYEEAEDEIYVPEFSDLILSHLPSQSTKHRPGLTPDPSVKDEEEPVAPHPDEPGTSQSHRSSKIKPEEAASMSKTFKERMAEMKKKEEVEQEHAHLVELEHRKELSLKASKAERDRELRKQKKLMSSEPSPAELERHFARQREIDRLMTIGVKTRSMTRKESEDKK